MKNILKLLKMQEDAIRISKYLNEHIIPEFKREDRVAVAISLIKQGFQILHEEKRPDIAIAAVNTSLSFIKDEIVAVYNKK